MKRAKPLKGFSPTESQPLKGLAPRVPNLTIEFSVWYYC